jgi:hypothetical protein
MTTLQPAHSFASSFLGDATPLPQIEPQFPSQPLPQVPSAATAQDGLYRGGARDVEIELRVDCTGLGVISGDVWRVSAEARHYVASFRTAPGERVTWASTWAVFGQDEHDRRSEGRLSLVADAAQSNTLIGRLEFASPLEGLPVRRAVTFIVDRVSGAFRRLGLEIEIEDGVTAPGRHTIDGRETTIESAMQAAGIDVSTSGLRDRIPRLGGGWQMAQLHTLMSDLAQSPMDMRAWHLHLLLLSRSDRRGLLGVMFDSADALPRQGCAVFVDEIRGIQGIDHERKLIQTTVHELGHALNLAHRFERVVGRADSTSFMNYDWRYRGGNRQDEFWNHFHFTFDPDELEFLRHAPMAPVIPGGAAFHSAIYWADGNGGYTPYVPEVPLAGWRLTITPANDLPVLHFAEPVMLRTVLTNTSTRAVEVPKFLLDPKAGFIEISIRRVHAGNSGDIAGAASFAPVMQRCFQWDAADDMRLNPGESMEDDVNLTFGSGGFSFAEPGTYDVHALLVLFDNVEQRELVARSNTVRLRIAAPRSDDEEHDALDFFVPSVGMYIALGGAPTLASARSRIESIVDRRRGNLDDSTVANLTKTMAFDDARTYVRYRDGDFVEQTSAVERAATAAGALVEKGAFAHDPLTSGRMRELADSCKAVTEGRKASVHPLAEPRRLSAQESRQRVTAAESMSPPRRCTR